MLGSTAGKENAAASSDGAMTTMKPPAAPLLPTLHVDRDGACTIDAGQVPLGQSKALPFAIAGGGSSGRLEVERRSTASLNVQVTLGPRSGIVLWTPVSAGQIRESITLIDEAGSRAQLLVVGQAVGAAAMAPAGKATSATTNIAATVRQPLRPATSIQNRPAQQLQQPLGAATKAKAPACLAPVETEQEAPAPTPRGGAAWEIGVEAFTPARKRPQPASLATPAGPHRTPGPGRELSFMASKSPATAVRAKSASSSTQGAPAPFPRQEKVLCEWLNHTLLPPTPAQSLPHPAQFLKMQDDETKARVQTMYASVDFERLRQAIRREIARKRLQLREDRDLFADLSLREAFLELLLCYQLPWLQLGLEVVLGVEVDRARLATGRDGQLVRVSTLSALGTLITQRVLADPAISQRYGASGTKLVHGRAREAMAADLRAHLLERFLCLLALLDHAKHLEVLPRRRPLFRPSAPHKSSAAILIEFAKAYMAGEGNLAKHLGQMGYYVGHEQTFLEEFDFRTSQLSRDLRDGVRLARLIDALEPSTSAAPLCEQLRVPAVSRLQKVHNLKLALTALQRAGLRLPGQLRVGPDDLIDGHPVKTVALLWAIARHYDQEELLASLPGVTRMQALARGRITRRRFLRLRGMALALQRLFRARQVLFRCRRFPLPAVLALQARWRGIRGRRAAAALREARAHAHAHAEEAAATALQAQARGLLARRRLAALRRGALTVQRLYRGHTARLHVHRLLVAQWATTRLQAQWRSRQQRRAYGTLRAATVMVQGLVRRRRALQQRRRMLAAALVVGKAARRWLARRQTRAVQASMVIQAAWRGKRVRALVAKWRAAAVVLQAGYRRHRARQRLGRLSAAAILVQALARGHLARGHQQRCQLAAARIQRQWAAHKAHRTFRAHINAVVAVQSFVRAHLARRRFGKALTAARLLQAWWRGVRCRSALHREQAAATRLQAAWRGKQARLALGTALRAVVQLQAWARGQRARAAAQAQWRALRVLQRAGRRFVTWLRAQRTQAAVAVQAVWRGHTVRRQLRQETLAVVRLQAAWRMTAARTRYVEVRGAVVVLQKWVRAQRARAQFAGLVTAAVAAQRIWRGHRARALLAKQRAAALVLQTAWRAAAQRRRYRQQRAAALRVQAAVRRWAAVRRYQRCLWGVRALQQRARQRRMERALQAHTAAVVRVQSLWRGHRVRDQVARERAAAARIQTYVRRFLVRARLRRAHRAVMRLQACLRGWRVRRVAGLKLRMLRARVAEANARAEADPSLRIGARHEAALEVLLTSKSCAHILKCCKTLELSTGLARECCEALVAVDGVPKLLAVVRSCNRSQPHMLLLRHILRILTQVASHPFLLPTLAEEPGAVETLADLLQTYRPDDLTFVPAATLLFSVCRAGALAKQDLQQPATLRKLQGSLRLLERKAEVEMKGLKASSRMQQGGKGKQPPEPSVAAPMRALRRVLELVEAGGKE